MAAACCEDTSVPGLTARGQHPELPQHTRHLPVPTPRSRPFRTRGHHVPARVGRDPWIGVTIAAATAADDVRGLVAGLAGPPEHRAAEGWALATRWPTTPATCAPWPRRVRCRVYPSCCRAGRRRHGSGRRTRPRDGQQRRQPAEGGSIHWHRGRPESQWVSDSSSAACTRVRRGLHLAPPPAPLLVLRRPSVRRVQLSGRGVGRWRVRARCATRAPCARSAARTTPRSALEYLHDVGALLYFGGGGGGKLKGVGSARG